MHCKSIIQAICKTLTADTTLADVRIISEFPSDRQDVPLQTSVISVGLKGVHIESSVKGAAVSSGDSAASCEFGLTVCVPRTETGLKCHDVIDRALQSIGSLIKTYSITDVSVGQMKYSSALGALTVPITLTINTGNAY